MGNSALSLLIFVAALRSPSTAEVVTRSYTKPLLPKDRAVWHCPREPDRTGQQWGFAYAAWRVNRELTPSYVKGYVIDAETGTLLCSQSLRDSIRTRDYHTAEDWQAWDERLWRMYWTRKSEDDPLTDVQDYLRQRTNERAKRLYYEQRRERWRAAWDVETERVGDKTLCRIT